VAAALEQSGEVSLRLLREVVGLGVEAVGALAGSVLVPDADGQHLRFLVAAGPTADRLAEIRVPIHRSIAGYVYSTGQMMALAEVPEDVPNYSREVARLTGTETRTYLALPVQAGGRTLGVSTYINRPGDPPFTPYVPDEVARAQTFAAALGVLLRYHEHTRLATTAAAAGLADVLAEPGLGPRTSAPPAWLRVAELMGEMSPEGQERCAELVELAGRWWKQEPG
jgi:hypothetical protein